MNEHQKGLLELMEIAREVLVRGALPHVEAFWDLEDHFEYLQEYGKISPEEAERLNEIMDAFAEAPQNQHFFGEDDENSFDAGETFDVPVGQLNRITELKYRYDYWGMEKYDLLVERGYQGGGYTWEGIIGALMELHAADVLPAVRFDAQSDCVCVWSEDVAALEKVAELVGRALESDELLLEAAARGARE